MGGTDACSPPLASLVRGVSRARADVDVQPIESSLIAHHHFLARSHASAVGGAVLLQHCRCAHDEAAHEHSSCSKGRRKRKRSHAGRMHHSVMLSAGLHSAGL